MAQRQHRLQDNYDWIVLGDSPAALLSAALVARMGLSVLIVADDSSKKWELSATGQLVDLEPNFFLGMARMERLGGVVAECLARLRLSPLEWQRFERGEFLFQACTPSVRASFSHQNELLERELKREAGSWSGLCDALAATEILSHGFWRYLPERLTLRDPQNQALPMEVPMTEQALRERVASLVAKAPPGVKDWFGVEAGPGGISISGSERLQEWLQGWIAGALGKEWPEATPYHALQLLSLARTGARLQGGGSALRQILLRLAVRLGAQCISPEGDARRIFVEDGRILGVQLGGRGSVIRTRGIAAGSSTELVRSWIEGRSPPLLQEHEGLRVTLALSVPRNSIPVGMHERCIWKENGAPALEIERSSPEAYGLPGHDHEAVFLRSVFPSDSMDWGTSRWRVVLARMHRQASEVIPFLEENEFRRFPDFRAADFEAQWNGFYGAGLSMARRELMRVPLKRAGKSVQLRIEGLFVLDGTQKPEWGSLGEFSDALEATTWMAHRSGLPGPLG